MAFLEWSDAYSVNVKELDEQHKVFLKLLNRIYEALDSQDSEKVQKEMDNLFQRLAHYAAYHFATEEGYFDKFGYPDAEEHKQKHREFYAKIMELTERYHEKKLAITVDVLEFMENWLIDHVFNQDKQFMEFFNSKGIK